MGKRLENRPDNEIVYKYVLTHLHMAYSNKTYIYQIRDLQKFGDELVRRGLLTPEQQKRLFRY